MTGRVYLALYKGKGTIDNALIRAWTRSPYSHCELVVDGIWYSSSLWDGGVRAKRIEYREDHWDLIEIPWANDQQILDHYDATKHLKYGWMDLIRSQIFNRAHDYSKAAFCSEWCAAAFGIPNPTIYSPGRFAELIQYLNQKY